MQRKAGEACLSGTRIATFSGGRLVFALALRSARGPLSAKAVWNQCTVTPLFVHNAPDFWPKPVCRLLLIGVPLRSRGAILSARLILLFANPKPTSITAGNPNLGAETVLWSRMNPPEASVVVEAVRVWTGWGRDIAPCRDDSLLGAHFGAELAAKLLRIVKSLEDEFYSSNARLIAIDPQEMEKISAEQFRKKHPDVAEDIVKALAWCYTFDFK